MSTITNAAITSINEQRHMDAREKAKKLILAIASSNTVIKARTAALDNLKAELKKLANDKFNLVEIAGTLPDTISAATVRATIDEMNKDEQDCVADRCVTVDSAIRGEQAALDAELFNRTELRKKLTEITVETVTATEINNA